MFTNMAWMWEAANWCDTGSSGLSGWFYTELEGVQNWTQNHERHIEPETGRCQSKLSLFEGGPVSGLISRTIWTRTGDQNWAYECTQRYEVKVKVKGTKIGHNSQSMNHWWISSDTTATLHRPVCMRQGSQSQKEKRWNYGERWDANEGVDGMDEDSSGSFRCQ
jgi:hypothetical protein